MKISEKRALVVNIAKTWLGTPYHTGGRVKNAGVDCLTLLAEVYSEAAIIVRPEIPYYPNDWHLHRSSERYLEGLLQYAHEVETPLAGDIAMWKFGRCFSHGAIVVEYPVIIHAYTGRECTLEDCLKAAWLGNREVRFFSVF